MILPSWCEYTEITPTVMDEILVLLPKHYGYSIGMRAVLINHTQQGYVGKLLAENGVISMVLNGPCYTNLPPVIFDLADPNCFQQAADRIKQHKSKTIESITLGLAQEIEAIGFTVSDCPGRFGCLGMIHVYKWIPSKVISDSIINHSACGPVKYMAPICLLYIDQNEITICYEGNCLRVLYANPICVEKVIKCIQGLPIPVR